jgi:hypothetical protein
MTITITALPLQSTLLSTTYIPVETANVTAHITAPTILNYVSTNQLTTIGVTTGTFGTVIAGAVDSVALVSSGDTSVGGNIYVTGNVVGVVSTGSQPYITNLSNVAIGNLAVTGITNLSGNVYPTANSSIGIGSSSSWFGAIYGTAVHALYADLAERYTSDSQYPPGTVVIFGTDTEVTASYQPNDTRVAGVVSTNPAYTMNSGIDGVDVALTGRVPCQVVGEVKRGDLMVTSAIPGVAMANNTPAIGTVIGKALGNYNSATVGLIEVVVGRV